MTSPTPRSGVSDAAHLAAILALPGVGPRHLDELLRRFPPAEAWAVVRRSHPTVDPAEPEALAARHRAAGVEMVGRADPAYPVALAGDPYAPHVLFHRGALGAFRAPLVALVGTRRCSVAGRELAAGWAEELARCGVGVVSGLALGIDAAAHRGALANQHGAAPVGVVGSGLDVVYPAANRSLWAEVARRGCLLSECPLGSRPEPWRFPARNRIIAALADVTVVVESHERGGALLTAAEAADRGRTVLAVPGSVRAGSARGTNRLIADGSGVALDVEDVVTALRLVGHDVTVVPRSGAPAGAPSGAERSVWEVLDMEVSTIDLVVARTGLSLDRACVLLDRLERAGLVARAGSGFIRLDAS